MIHYRKFTRVSDKNVFIYGSFEHLNESLYNLDIRIHSLFLKKTSLARAQTVTFQYHLLNVLSHAMSSSFSLVEYQC